MSTSRVRVRDHAAENRRRNELARERGYTSRAALRTAKVKGREPRGPAPKPAPYVRAGFGTEKEYKAARKESAGWSRKHSQQTVSQYRPSGQHRSPERFRDYYNAFVRDAGRKGRGAESRRRAALKHYLVDVEEYVDSEVFDAGY